MQSFWGSPRVRQRAYEMRLHHSSLFHFQYVWRAVWAAISPCVHHIVQKDNHFILLAFEKNTRTCAELHKSGPGTKKTKKPSFPTESLVWDSKDVVIRKVFFGFPSFFVFLCFFYFFGFLNLWHQQTPKKLRKRWFLLQRESKQQKNLGKNVFLKTNQQNSKNKNTKENMVFWLTLKHKPFFPIFLVVWYHKFKKPKKTRKNHTKLGKNKKNLFLNLKPKILFGKMVFCFFGFRP